MKLRKFRFHERHIIWNWEQSPDDPKRVRYHIIIADDKNRESKLHKFLESLAEKTIFSSPFEEVRKIEGKFPEQSTGIFSQVTILLTARDSHLFPAYLQM